MRDRAFGLLTASWSGNRLEGVLDRLFDVADYKFNIVVELTVGNRCILLWMFATELDAQIKDRPSCLHASQPAQTKEPTNAERLRCRTKLNFDPKYKKTFQQVFGKTRVCRDLTIAASYVINTITLDGDKVDRKSAMTGGYHDVQRSRIEGVKSVRSWRANLETESKCSQEAKASIMKLEQEIMQMNGRIMHLTANRTTNFT